MLFNQLTSQITIEPAVFLFACSVLLSDLSGQNLLLLKMCFDDEAPSPGQSDCRNEVGAQKEVTYIQTWRDVITAIGPVVFVMFAGTWSDRHGRRRKPLLYIPLFGHLTSDLLCMLNIHFWKWSPNFTALAQSIPIALTGGKSCFQLGEIAYICDITTESSRTFRICVVFAVKFLASPFANFFFGLVFNFGGLYGLYTMSVTFTVLTIVYLYVFIKENRTKDKSGENTKKMFDFEHLMQCVKSTFKPREGYRRAVILLLATLAPLTSARAGGLNAVIYLFFRYKFQWCPIQFGYYGAYIACIYFTGTFITIGVFQHLLGISDTMIGIWSQISELIASIGFAFAHTTLEILLWPLVDFMHGAGMAIIYSILSKNIASSEIAQVTSFVSIAEATYPLINLPLFNQLYNHTIEVLPGAIFLLSAFYSVITLVLFVVTHVLQKKTDFKDKVIQSSG